MLCPQEEHTQLRSPNQLQQLQHTAGQHGESSNTGTGPTVLPQTCFPRVGEIHSQKVLVTDPTATLTQQDQGFSLPCQHLSIQLPLPLLQVLPLLSGKASGVVFQRRSRGLQSQK